MRKNNSALFFTCSLIEFIGRTTKNTRLKVLEFLGKEDVERIYRYADVFHCEPMEKVADDFIEKDHISDGTYDNVAEGRFLIPDYWDIGDVFARLIEDCYEEQDVISGIWEVYSSWIADAILNFNSDVYKRQVSFCGVRGGASVHLSGDRPDAGGDPL